MDELILVDMGPHQVLELLETLTGKIILRRQDIPAVKINFNSRGPLTQSEAVLALESLLTLNSIMLTDMGGKFMKAVPATEVNRHVPEMLSGSTLELSASQQIYAKLFKLNYLNAQETSGTMISNLVSQNSSFVVFEKANAILITDALINLQRIEAMLKEADYPQNIREDIQFVKLSFIQAGEMQDRLDNLIKGPLKTYLEGSTSVTADERTNQLIIITHPENMKVIQQVIDSIDIDAAPLTGSEVFPLRQAKAEEVVPIIENIISGQEEGREDDSKVSLNNGQNNAPSGGTPAAPALQAPAPAAPTAPSGSESNSSLQFSQFVGLSADERTNSIVAYGTTNDLRTLKELIDKIDIPLPQVRIEVIITEVTLTENQASGLSSFAATFNDRPDITNLPVQGTGPVGLGLDNFNISSQIGDFAISAVLDLAEDDDNVKILSTPSIVVSHNEEGKINVSQSRPIETGTTTNTTSETVTNQIEYRDVGIQLTVTPLIGADGSVTMTIEQTVDTIFSESSTTNTGDEDGTTSSVDTNPVIGVREANSTITVNDREVIILGGLQENQREVSRTYFPIIGRMPLIGDLLSGKQIEYNRTELIIFVRPTILRNPQAATELTEKALEILGEGERVREYLDTHTTGEIYMEGSKYEPEFDDSISKDDDTPEEQ